MNKHVLMVATVPSMIGQFNMNNIRILQDMGYVVDVACDYNDRSVWPTERVQNFKKQMAEMGIQCIQLDFSRSPFKIGRLIRSYKETLNLIKERKYSFIHTHTPIASAVVRLAAQKTGTKVIYTAHGFHFYDGAPKKNWFIYYPIEKCLSKYTDVLITINKEDYKRACDSFNAKKTVYIPGVGFDTGKFRNCVVNRTEKRSSMNLRDEDFLMISVGELSSRKNQKVVIDALNILSKEGKIDNILYMAIGKGELENSFKELIRTFKLEKHVRLEGFRQDIPELCKAADCFIHPSVREGLGIAPLEAMAAGLPLISAYVNGIKDYTENGKSGVCVNPHNAEDVANAIYKMYSDRNFRVECGKNNVETSKAFDVTETNKIMKTVYERID